MKAQKKPVIIDYLPYNNKIQEVIDWVDTFAEPVSNNFKYENSQLFVKTLEGTSYEVTENDVIIRGIKGEYYPCKKDIFEQTYDKINQ